MMLQYSQKTENKLKVCPESMYIPQKVSAVTKKYSKLKVLIKTSFCRNVCLPLTSETLHFEGCCSNETRYHYVYLRRYRNCCL